MWYVLKRRREAGEILIVIANILGTFQKKKNLGKFKSQCAWHSFLCSLTVVLFLKFNVTQGLRFKLTE